jgi:ferredoxin
MYTIIYLSPTGNAKHLAKLLANELQSPLEDILPLEFTDPAKLMPNKHLILLFPVHAFNAARTAKRFVKNLPAGLYEYLSLIGVGCADHWVNSAVTSDLKKALQKKEYAVIVDEILAMPLTFVMNFPDEMNLKLIAEAEQNIKNICRNITKLNAIRKKVPGKAKLINFLGKGESPAARLFGLELHANKDCTSYGICWENCPEKNIRQKENDKPGFRFNCMMCMRCIYNCPENAISPRISKFIPIKKGYSLSKYIKD